jgi:TolB protein
MNKPEGIGALLGGLAVVTLILCMGCAGSGAGLSLETVLGQPNGGITGSTEDQILFISVRTQTGEVWSVDASGQEEPIRLTAFGAQAQTPAWSPDGRQFIFSLSFLTEAPLRRARIDNQTLTNSEGQSVYFLELQNSKGSNFAPSWSVNDRIAFHSDRDRGEFEIYTSDINGNDLVRLTDNEWSDNSPKWSPDGSQIVFSSNRDTSIPDIFIMNADGTAVRKLTSSAEGWASLAPEFSPDGTEIVYVLQDPEGNRDIYVMDTDGGSQRRLTDDGRGHHHPSWSPDGTRIAYERFGREPVPDVWVMNADGTGKMAVTTDQDFDAQPAWSPMDL